MLSTPPTIVKRSVLLGFGLTATLILQGCGFHPMYAGRDSAMGATLSAIYVEPMPDRLGYELRNSLIDLLNGSGSPAGASYRLKLSFSETSQEAVLQNCPPSLTPQANCPPPSVPLSNSASSSVTRYNDHLKVSYELSDMQGKVIKSGVETGLASYNVLPGSSTANYATLAGQQDADKRAAEDMAERIHLDLASFFNK